MMRERTRGRPVRVVSGCPLDSSGVEPLYGLNPGMLITKASGHLPDRGRAAPRHQHGTTLQSGGRSLPVRVPGE
jgi:hypothetical protein